MKKSSILLATLCKFNVLEKLCISNYKYIAYKNNIDFFDKQNYTLQNIFDNRYDYLLCMNHFSVFLIGNIDSLTIKFNEQTHNIILPKKCDLPIELVPCYIRNCSWSQKFISSYIRSQSHNLQKFINTNNSTQYVLFTDDIQIEKTNYTSIIQSYIDLPPKQIINKFHKHNSNLGIL